MRKYEASIVCTYRQAVYAGLTELGEWGRRFVVGVSNGVAPHLSVPEHGALRTVRPCVRARVCVCVCVRARVCAISKKAHKPDHTRVCCTHASAPPRNTRKHSPARVLCANICEVPAVDLATVAGAAGLYMASGLPGWHQEFPTVNSVATVGEYERYWGGRAEFVRRLPFGLGAVQVYQHRHAREDLVPRTYDRALARL